MKEVIFSVFLFTCMVSIAVCSLMGGWQNVSVNAPEVHSAAQTSLDLFDDSNTEGLAQRLQNVVSAKSQVVSGVNYDLVAEVGLLGCSEAEVAANGNCPLTKVGECEFKIYIQSWTGTNELTSWNCGDFKNVH